MYFYFVYHHNCFILLLLLTLPKSNWCKVINTVMFIERIEYESYCMLGIISYDWNEKVNHFLGGLKKKRNAHESEKCLIQKRECDFLNYKAPVTSA